MHRELKWDKQSGNILTDGRPLLCPIASRYQEAVICNIDCAYYSENQITDNPVNYYIKCRKHIMGYIKEIK